MSGFSPEWLALRARADDAARDPALLRRAADWAGDGLIADIGGGTGATFRALAPLAPKSRWRVLDHDAGLLARLPADGRIEAVEADLSTSMDEIFAHRPRLVTASAFFDLASLAWIEAFTDRLAASGAALYAVLTYDGREEWRPDPPHEAVALAAFHRDMARDKGLGSALGPAAHKALSVALRARGYEVTEAQSDWRLTRGRDDAMISALAEGGASAVGDALDPDVLKEWVAGRAAAKDVLVGHKDLFATPTA